MGTNGLAGHRPKRPSPLPHHHLRKDTEAQRGAGTGSGETQEDISLGTPPASQPSSPVRASAPATLCGHQTKPSTYPRQPPHKHTLPLSTGLPCPYKPSGILTSSSSSQACSPQAGLPPHSVPSVSSVLPHLHPFQGLSPKWV